MDSNLVYFAFPLLIQENNETVRLKAIITHLEDENNEYKQQINKLNQRINELTNTINQLQTTNSEKAKLQKILKSILIILKIIF